MGGIGREGMGHLYAREVGKFGAGREGWQVRKGINGSGGQNIPVRVGGGEKAQPQGWDEGLGFPRLASMLQMCICLLEIRLTLS